MLKDYHELLISFTRSKDSAQKEEQYQATVRQKGLLGEGGPFRKRETLSLKEVHELQKDYQEQIKFFHDKSGASPDPKDLLDLGYRISEVLPVQTRGSLQQALVHARKHKCGLRIILEFDPNALALMALPWELMALRQISGSPISNADTSPANNPDRHRVDKLSATAKMLASPDHHARQAMSSATSLTPTTPSYVDHDPVSAAEVTLCGSDFLLLHADVSMLRQVRGIGEARPLDLNRPSLRLQAFVAQPEGEQPIDAQSVKRAVETVGASAGLYSGPDTLGHMQERLRKDRPEIVHILCHGTCSDLDGYGMRNDLLFTHGDGHPRRVSVFELVPTLSLAKELQLVVLHACHSATQASDSGAQNEQAAETPRLVSESIALGTLRAGVRVVVAFQSEVAQEPATTFMHAFYDTLSTDQRLDQAVAAGRIAMLAHNGMADWSLPVVYRGHAEPETATPLTRLADQVEIWLADPRFMWTTRAGQVGLALLLLLFGLIRWVFLPPIPLPLQRADLQPLLTVWFMLGLLSPAIIAAMHRGVRLRQDLTKKLRQQALVSQWTGAYLGYMIWNMVGLASGAILVLLDLSGLTATREVQIGWLVVTVVSSWFISYVIARRMVKSCLAQAPYNPELFDPRGQWIIFVGVPLIQGIPLAGVWTDNPEAAWFLHPVNASFIFAIGLLSIAHWLLRDAN